MIKIRDFLIIPAILLLISGCIKREPEIVTTDNTPNTIPIAQTYPMPTQPIPYPTQPTQPTPYPITPTYPITSVVVNTQPQPQYIPQRTPYLRGAYASNYKLKQLINNMASKYHLDKYELNAIFSTVNRDNIALDKYGVFKKRKPTTSKASLPGSWSKYRAQFVNPRHIKKGVQFWRENANWLNMAAYKYGVDPAYIVGIIGVETNFGGFTGKHSVLDALTTLALEYKKRSKFFTSELENYILLIKEQRLPPQAIKGSYAGAFGLAQFMPSSFREYAVDLNGDGHKNLFDPADAIGSIANYFINKGKWNPRIPVAMMTYYNKKRFYGIPTGYKTSYSQRYLYNLGMRPSSNFYGYKGPVSLIKLSKYDRDELWWGTPNFRAITRYNPKDYYAMAVHQLGQEIKKAYYGR